MLPAFLLKLWQRKKSAKEPVPYREATMFVTRALARLTMCAGLMALPIAIPTAVYAQQTVTVGPTDIGGTVVSAAGPEAGV